MFEVDAILDATKTVLKSDGFSVTYDPAESSNHNNIFKTRVPNSICISDHLLAFLQVV